MINTYSRIRLHTHQHTLRHHLLLEKKKIKVSHGQRVRPEGQQLCLQMALHTAVLVASSSTRAAPEELFNHPLPWLRG